ncbi:uncharacterized protein PADG_03298 [Paracoccidioides brasiliensis Pb18]|uniref:Uncharacterized protein n=1 Tax=Paracoccidioides brasiliensis (strain Pb18) TaxID=502780 RepID=C1G7Z3_PARBD|nr:uncharacterized protein PADG_03298 [Paracoccidioides brasiliensis Pb18]EEH47200.2 hypothetical protein PADG_03298 [Paracoccidioides brasiliensis Pb18]
MGPMEPIRENTGFLIAQYLLEGRIWRKAIEELIVAMKQPAKLIMDWILAINTRSVWWMCNSGGLSLEFITECSSNPSNRQRGVFGSINVLLGCGGVGSLVDCPINDHITTMFILSSLRSFICQHPTLELRGLSSLHTPGSCSSPQ